MQICRTVNSPKVKSTHWEVKSHNYRQICCNPLIMIMTSTAGVFWKHTKLCIYCWSVRVIFSARLSVSARCLVGEFTYCACEMLRRRVDSMNCVTQTLRCRLFDRRHDVFELIQSRRAGKQRLALQHLSEYTAETPHVHTLCIPTHKHANHTAVQSTTKDPWALRCRCTEISPKLIISALIHLCGQYLTAFQIKLINRIHTIRWMPPDYRQTDNFNGQWCDDDRYQCTTIKPSHQNSDYWLSQIKFHIQAPLLYEQNCLSLF